MTRILVIILSVIALAACSRSLDDRLVRVNRLANENLADSAMQALDSIDRASLDEYNRHYYDLMTVKTRDKADFQFDSDSLVLSAMEYFKKNGTDTVRAEAFYYAGRVARMLGDSPQALDYMQNALNCLDDSHTRLKGKISSQMGQIFQELYMFEQAKPRFIEAIHFQNLCNDSLGLMFNYRDLGETYKFLQLNDSAIHYIKTSLNIAICQNYSLIDVIESRIILIDCYLEKSEYELARTEFSNIEQYLEDDNICNSVLATGINMYLLDCDFNNAEKLSLRLIQRGNLYGNKIGYRVLANIREMQNQIDESKEYTALYRDCLDSINAQSSKDAVIYQNSFYNYSLRERDNAILKNKQRLSHYIIVSIIFICILIFLLLLLITERNKSLRRQLELQLSRIQFLENNGNKIEPVITSTKSIEQLKTDLEEKYRNFVKDVAIADYKVSEMVLSSSIYLKIKESLSSTNISLNEDDWFELDKIINTAYPKFKINLYYMCDNISTHEYHICLLIKCKMGSTNIGKLTFRDKTSIASTRKRLYRKFFLEDGSANDFDKFIYSL